MKSVLDVIARIPDGNAVVIGSARQADVVLGSQAVEARHSQVRRRGRSLFIRDLDSAGGTFVNSREVRGEVEIYSGDRLKIGDVEILIPTDVAPADDGRSEARGARLDVVEAVKRVRAGGSESRTILDRVSFRADAGEFVGILGTSGSGKSTLIKAIAGIDALTDGAVLLNRLPHTAMGSDQSAIAYLPQDVVIHEALTAGTALDYIAQLKNLGDSRRARKELVRDALERVGMGERADVAIHSLSGGQKKRIALAAELLGNPKMLLLDEATSGLDPATEADMMDLFRSLADEGRTVLCITHFPGRLHLCDRLIYLMQGHCIFEGTPEELKTFFGVSEIEDAYRKQGVRTVDEWKARYRASSMNSNPPVSIPSGDSNPFDPPDTLIDFPAVARQLRILTSRYFRLQLADLRNLVLLIAQAPIIAAMIGVTFRDIHVYRIEQRAADTKLVAFVMVLAILWSSGTLSVREIVREIPIMRHERRFGVGVFAYLGSKMALLGAISLLQAFLLLSLVQKFTSFSDSNLTNLGGAGFGQLLILSATALAGVCLGLFVSATAGTSERAMTVLPVLLIGQAVFSGGLADLDGKVGWFADSIHFFAKLFVSAYWALDGIKGQFSQDLWDAHYPGSPGGPPPAILGAGEPLYVAMPILLIQSLLLFTCVYTALRRGKRLSDR